jgi:hypothetical protein
MNKNDLEIILNEFNSVLHVIHNVTMVTIHQRTCKWEILVEINIVRK